jgi:Flp pilus assembly protein TadD
VGKYDAAISDFSRAIELAPQESEPYFNRGVTHHQMGDRDAAIRDYSEAIKLAPDNADPYLNRGFDLYDKSEFEAAISDFDAAVHRGEQGCYVYLRRGIANHKLGRHAAATADLREGIRRGPDEPRVYAALAMHLATCSDANSRNGKEAVQVATRGCELSHGEWVPALAALAAAQAESGEWEQALKSQKQAVDLAAKGTGDANRFKLHLLRVLTQYEQHQPYRDATFGL